MSERWELEAGMEPERYELDEPGSGCWQLDRREFFKLLGGGIVVLLLLDVLDDAAAQAQRGGRRFGGQPVPNEIGAWLHVDEEGNVTAYTGKAEVGQNIRTSLAQVVAEELRVPINRIRLVMADTQLTPYDAGTFGSRTTPVMAAQLRKVAAATRELLLDLAAEEWKTDRAALTIADGKVASRDARQSLDFGKLTRGRKLTQTVAENVPTTPPTDWKIAGQSIRKVEGRAFVTGAHRFSTDVQLPGMLYGKILRSPAFGSTLASADTGDAAAIPGVTVVRDRDFVGVVAPTEYAASQALQAIRAEWTSSPQVSASELFEHFRMRGGGPRLRRVADGDIRLNQAYTVAYIAHAPLEPRAAVAQWEGDRLTVWTGTQRPFGVRGELSAAFGIPEANIRVIVPDTGSAYGGKHTGEAAVEAARLARGAGKPVKLVWTRAEEFTWAYFRPAGLIEVSSGARRDGVIAAWELHNYNSGASAIRSPYDIPNQVAQFHTVASPLRQGSYRALASVANTFARETHMDELAHALELDPLEFRLRNLKDERLRAAFEAAAKAFGWGGKPRPGHGFGIAGGYEKGSYVATCAEVHVDEAGRVRVLRAVSAYECGAILNPDHVRSQVEGAMVQGLGGALTEAIEFENGEILNPRFSKYRVPRFSDLPEIEVVLLDRKDLPSVGAGETPIIGIAPAIGNAIFAATGQRLRSLPLAPKGLKQP